MNHKLSFEELNTKLLPALNDLEVKRRAMKAEATKNSALCSVALIAVSTLISMSFNGFPVGLLIGVILAIILSIVIFNSQKEKLSVWYKEQIITRFVDVLVENGKYQRDSGISEQTFRDSNLYSNPDRYHSEDLISGKIGQTPFCFSEVHAEERQTRTDSKGRTQTTWTTLFKGFMFVADFNKDFSANTVVARDTLFHFGSNRVKLENVEFEKRFDVYSSDQVEARYILSPSMMERIVALDKKFDDNIVISFYRSNIIIGISNSRNHFEASLWTPITDASILQREYTIISALTDIIDDLNLNVRIWTKE